MMATSRASNWPAMRASKPRRVLNDTSLQLASSETRVPKTTRLRNFDVPDPSPRSLSVQEQAIVARGS